MDQELPHPSPYTDLTPTQEGSYLGQVALDNFLEDFRGDLFRALRNYWVSRALFALGIVSTYIFGWPLMGFVLFVDLLLQNPHPIYPRDILVRAGKMVFSLARGSKQKIKKPE